MHDVQLILDNSLKFNGLNHPVTRNAEEMVSIMQTYIRDHIKEPENAISCHIKSSKAAREDSSSKKKPIVVFEKIEEPDEEEEEYHEEKEEEEILTRRRYHEPEITHMATRRKRKLSSDYEE